MAMKSMYGTIAIVAWRRVLTSSWVLPTVRLYVSLYEVSVLG